MNFAETRPQSPSDAEPFLAPRDLAEALNRAQVRGPGGHTWTPRAARKVVAALRAAGRPVIRRYRVRASDAAALAATGWRPYARPLVDTGGRGAALVVLDPHRLA